MNQRLVVRIGIGVDDKQQHDAADHAEQMLSFLPILEPVETHHMGRVLAGQLGVFERDAVLDEIAPSLGRVPFEAQRHSIA